jgi:Histidine kinase-, DNA gyrase B-, and HSP90-like ATPase
MSEKKEIDLSITVLGRTLEHLGVQMYKRRDTAIAELVANCWDAGASNVNIYLPTAGDYDQRTSSITIQDDGSGMGPTQIQEEYLVVGRNRRQAGGTGAKGRVVMGRKGIGKLAGFGLASEMNVLTWRDKEATEFTLDIDDLKQEDGKAGSVGIKGRVTELPDWAKTPSGTRLVLRDLKHKSALDEGKLSEALARRFSRTIRGEMKIFVNGQEVGEPNLELDERFPQTGYFVDKLADGSEVKFYYAFTKETIKSAELRGFTIYVRGKTAQAPPFFFHVEATASGQHATKYVTGAIEADFLDESSDDRLDLISTDRQEIDWESEVVKPLHEWGDALARRVLRECTERKGKRLHDWILQNQPIAVRVEKLDPASQKQVRRFLLILGEAEPEQERALDLADSLVRAFEYRHFHDVIAEMEVVAANPEELGKFLSRLHEWKVLESRAVLEVIKGRLEIIKKFHEMIVNDAPETKSKDVSDNLHDLIAGSPWLLNPEWQVLSEEKSLSRQLAEWGDEDIPEQDKRLRYDFLALTDDKQLVVLEIKRANHAVTLEDLQRLERYKERLTKAHTQNISMVMICGGTVDVSDAYRRTWDEREDGEIRNWNEVYERVRLYYEHYRAILEGDVKHADFSQKQDEVAQTRQILETGSVHRDREARKAGLGVQDSNYEVGILAYGSLNADAGEELTPLIQRRIEGVMTPFGVEFARRSDSRDGAPTLAPVDSAGSPVQAALLIMRPGVTVEDARNMLWRREIHAVIGSKSRYAEENGELKIHELVGFEKIGHVLYVAPRANINPLNVTTLAALAVESAKRGAGKRREDGISYLIGIKKNGAATPLMPDYESAILQVTGQSTLQGAWEKSQETTK